MVIEAFELGKNGELVMQSPQKGEANGLIVEMEWSFSQQGSSRKKSNT